MNNLLPKTGTDPTLTGLPPTGVPDASTGPDWLASAAVSVSTAATELSTPTAPTTGAELAPVVPGKWETVKRLAAAAIGRRPVPQPSHPEAVPNETVNPADAAEILERRGWVRNAPTFISQVKDRTRTNRFKYERYDRHGKTTDTPGEMSEYEGLQDLSKFVRNNPKASTEDYHGKLSFIGEKEYAEAAKGYAAHYKRYLDDNPDAQLCLLTLIGDAYGAARREVSREAKSDHYMLERILKEFTGDLEQYKGRLVFSPTELTANPANARVVMLDDWVMGGTQMSTAFTIARSQMTGEIEKYQDSMEINLIAMSGKQLEAGRHYPNDGSGKGVRIRAYYATPTGRITGTHSSVDTTRGWLAEGRRFPPLLRVVREYRTSNRPEYRKAKAALAGPSV